MTDKKKIVLLLAAFLAAPCLGAYAQYYPTHYRPPALNWQQLETPHFRIVFPAGEDSAAWAGARILESQYAAVQSYVGGRLEGFPVILNNYTDVSNGFVTPLHFRSEIFLSPFKGKALNPGSGSWLESIGPHELTHALHLSHLDPFGVSGLLSILSPDLARAMHSAVPAGIPEGIAVQHETHGAGLPSGAGRGEYPFFANQFNAVFNSADRWSMGQMVHLSTDTRPFNRHYIGGYEFVHWLQETYGPETTRDAIDFYNRLPFLGYGVALRHATGQWPNQLYEQFEADKKEALKEQRLPGPAINIDLPYEGEFVRRPKWLSDSLLVFFGSFYNARSGFYTHSLSDGATRRLFTTGSVDDFQYALSQDGNELVYSYYRADPLYGQAAKAELVRTNISSATTRRLAKGSRLFGPAVAGDRIFALQTHQTNTRLVEVDKEGTVTILAAPEEMQIKSVAVHPSDPSRLAVIANKRGVQALWLVEYDSIGEGLANPPELSFGGGSVFDPEWHPKGDRLLFAADYTGTLNLYEYHPGRRRVSRVTGSLYNAFEGSYSPDGTRVVYTRQEGNEQKPAVLHRDDFDGTPVPAERWAAQKQGLSEQMNRPGPGHDVDGSAGWVQSSYGSGLGWLKPRTVMPFTEEIGNRNVYRWGAGFYSNNLLQTQSYSAEISTAEERHWYDYSYTNRSFFPGFRLSLSSLPGYSPFRFETTDGFVERTMLRQERSIALSVPARFALDQNVYFTSLNIVPELRRSQIRYFELAASGGGAASGFANLTIANLFASLNYRLRQNIRDVQPNSGWVVFGELEHYLSSDNIIINTLGNRYGFTFSSPTALRGGVFTWISPFRRWNQSLRVGLQGITQTAGVFDNQSIVSNAFRDPVYPASRNLVSLNTRYTIPLAYPDDGGFLVPLYLSNLYLALFSNTVTDPRRSNPLLDSQTVIGAGIRSRFRISNMAIDFGVGIGYQPGLNKASFVFGDF